MREQHTDIQKYIHTDIQRFRQIYIQTSDIKIYSFPTYRHTNIQAHRLADIGAYIRTDGHLGIQIYQHFDIKIYGQTGHTNLLTYRQTDRHIDV